MVHETSRRVCLSLKLVQGGSTGRHERPHRAGLFEEPRPGGLRELVQQSPDGLVSRVWGYASRLATRGDHDVDRVLAEPRSAQRLHQIRRRRRVLIHPASEGPGGRARHLVVGTDPVGVQHDHVVRREDVPGSVHVHASRRAVATAPPRQLGVQRPSAGRAVDPHLGDSRRMGELDGRLPVPLTNRDPRPVHVPAVVVDDER